MRIDNISSFGTPDKGLGFAYGKSDTFYDAKYAL